jgi:CRP-like cAMP-binding protein
MNLDPSAFVADPALIVGLEKGSTYIPCDEDRVLFHQGEAPTGLYILKAGRVTLTMNSTLGEEIISATAEDGSLLGLPGLIGDEAYSLTAVAKAGSQVSYVTRESFTSLMSADPMLAFKILTVLAAEVRSARSVILHR